MSKIKKSKAITKINVEMQYTIAEASGDSNWVADQTIFNRSRLSDEFKKTMFPSIRANYSAELSTKNKNLGQLMTEVQELVSSEQHKAFVSITQRFQQYIVANTVLIFPDLEQKHDEIVADDITNRLTFDKAKMTYNTIIYRRFETNTNFAEIEPVILDFLQEYVDNGLESFVELSAHFSCTYYLINGKMEYTLQEFIDHRRTNLKLKDNSHLIKS